PVTWNDGCLGIEPDDGACTQALVDGWVVWALADGSAHRFHTDTTTDVRLAESGIDPDDVVDAPLPDGATPRTDGEPASIISGDIPSEGVALFEVVADASVTDIRMALAEQGCNAEVLAKTVDGRWYLYSFEAPDFVNEGFFASDGSSESAVAAGTLLMTNCLEGGASPTPTPSPTMTPTPTPDGFSTDDVDESDREGPGALADVNVEAGDGADMITFEFADELE